MQTQIFILLLLLTTVYQCFIWIFVYPKAAKKSFSNPVNKQILPVSIIVCIQNETDYLFNILTSLSMMDYPEYEIILVNDGPNPKITKIFENLHLGFSKLKLINHNKKTKGKKLALSHGIQKAQYDWILLTDIDCEPKSNQWISKMMNARSEHCQIVLGYSPYKKTKGFLNQFIRYENLINAIQYLSAAQIKFPYMGVGRNLLYQKSIFDLGALQLNYVSGDDDLLINAKSTSTNTKTCIHEDSWMLTNAKKTWLAYFNQRKRHYSTSKAYSFSSQLYLILASSSLFIFYFSTLYLIFHLNFLFPTLCYLLHITVSCIILMKLSKTFKNSDIIVSFPLLEIVYLLFILVQFPFIFIKKLNW